jgi:hypothetical protein
MAHLSAHENFPLPAVEELRRLGHTAGQFLHSNRPD